MHTLFCTSVFCCDAITTVNMIGSHFEPCFWNAISGRVDDSSKLMIVVDNAKSHNVREASNMTLGFSSTHSCHSGNSSNCWTSSRRSNRWETSGSTKPAVHQANNSYNHDSVSESSDPDSLESYDDVVITAPDSASSTKGPYDTHLRLPTRKMSDPAPRRIASVRKPGLPLASHAQTRRTTGRNFITTTPP